METPPLTDDTVRLALVGQVLRRRWRLLTALAVLGAGVGAAASLVLSPGYQTTSSVLLQGPRQADELLTQAEVATSSVVLDRASAALPWHPAGADLQKKVTAAVSNGNVVTLTVSADSAEHAQQLAVLKPADVRKRLVRAGGLAFGNHLRRGGVAGDSRGSPDNCNQRNDRRPFHARTDAFD